MNNSTICPQDSDRTIQTMEELFRFLLLLLSKQDQKLFLPHPK